MKEVITLLITSGGLGFANVLFLERIGILSFNKTINNDRYLWLTIFTALNFTTYQMTYDIFKTIIISLFATLMVSLFNYRLENWIRSNILNSSEASDNQPWDLMWKETGKQPYVYVFNFDNKMIQNGYLYSVQPDVNGRDIVLNTPSEYYLDMDYQELMDWLSEQQGKSINSYTYIDYANKTKVIAISSFEGQQADD